MNARIPRTREMIEELVASPSVSCHAAEFDQGNRAVVASLASWAEGLGFAVELMQLPHHPDKLNLIARLGQGDGGLVLSGHTDTVPWDEGRWSSDPFRATERDGRLYGLGTADMKAFLALALEAASAFDAGGLTAPVTLLATADEESTMAGARAVAERGQSLGQVAVIGEPTSLRPIRMHKGILMELIRLEGRSGHSSNPALGVSALEGMHALMTELMSFRDDMQAAHVHGGFDVPYPTLNLGAIRGGDSPNRICASCQLDIDLRPIPGMDVAGARRELRARLAPVAAAAGCQLEFSELFRGVDPLETPADSPLVRAMEEITGHPSASVAFGTEGPFLAALGMDVVVCGPGSIDQAHQPDEYLSLSDLAPCVDQLRQLIARFCVA
jgi:acetylornithine deacetylase